jgi:hypothetical protein
MVSNCCTENQQTKKKNFKIILAAQIILLVNQRNRARVAAKNKK